MDYAYAAPEITIAPDFAANTPAPAEEREKKDHTGWALLGGAVLAVAILLALGWCVEKSRKRRND